MRRLTAWPWSTALLITAAAATLAGATRTPGSVVDHADPHPPDTTRALRAPAAAADTVVSLTFDDGDATQVLAGDLMLGHGMHGTFYINSGPLDRRDGGHLSWAQVSILQMEGNEIGGHTTDHIRLTDPAIPEAVKRKEICGDRERLQQMGFSARSFAYPYGALNRAAEQLVESCGYQSARSAGDVSAHGSLVAETVPPPDPFATRALDGPRGATAEGPGGPLSLLFLQEAVVSAADHGGGWVQIVFHRICAPTDPRFDRCMATESPVEVSTFLAFLDWLKYEAPPGTTVRTVGDVMTDAPVHG